MGKKLRNIIRRIRGFFTCFKKTSYDIDIVLQKIDKDLARYEKKYKS